MLKLLIILALLGGGYYFYQKRQQASAVDAAAPATVSSNGFQLLPAGARQGRSVMVIAQENCPQEDAQRADRLAADLKSAGVPVQRTHGIQFTMTEPDPAGMERMNAVMNGTLPIVIVNGRGKANPTLSEVIAEYRDGR